MTARSTLTRAPVSAIRPVALCVFRRDDRVLVYESRDPVSGARFVRPFGGGIEFGERAVEALRREIREELGQEIEAPRLLGVLENLFEHAGQPGHEVHFAFDARFRDPVLARAGSVSGREADGRLRVGRWRSLGELARGRTPLVPKGLLELLEAGG